MSLICMAVYDTEENQRENYTKRTLDSLLDTVSWIKHRIVIIDNASCQSAKDIIRIFANRVSIINPSAVTVITNTENLGTAKAVNKGLRLRQPGEFCIKMDNDIVVHQSFWVDDLQEAMERMPQIGILGLKRKDLQEHPSAINTDQRSRLLMVPQQAGQRWFVVEDCKQVMGSCTMLSPQLLDRVGFFHQCDGLYGFDDSLMCVRSSVAGFMNCFLPQIHIDHIDPGGTEYTDWKANYAGTMLSKFAQEEAVYKQGLKDVYHGGE